MVFGFDCWVMLLVYVDLICDVIVFLKNFKVVELLIVVLGMVDDE